MCLDATRKSLAAPPLTNPDSVVRTVRAATKRSQRRARGKTIFSFKSQQILFGENEPLALAIFFGALSIQE